MTPHRLSPTVRRYLVFAAFLDLMLLVIMGAICWFGGWRTAWDYGNGLTYAGLATLAVGALQCVGSFTRATDPIAGYHTTNLGEHLVGVRRAVGERDGTFATMLKLGLAGLVPIALGQLILTFVG